VSSSISTNTIGIRGVIPFYGGSASDTIPPHSSYVWRVDVPQEGNRWVSAATHESSVTIYIEQGSFPTSAAYHYRSYGADSSINQRLNSWPWIRFQSYFLLVANDSDSPQPFTFSMALPADLAPVSVLAPSFAATVPNPAIQIAWAVTNQGTAAALGSWYDRIWFSTNGLLDAQSLNLGDFSFSQPVAPGGTYWRTNSITLPMSGSGNYSLFVQTDIYNALYDFNLANNVSAPASGTFTLTPAVPPVFQSITQSFGSVTFTWSALPGRVYQVQFTSDLNQPAWSNLGGPITAANWTLTASDAIAPDPQRFYRLLLLP
jgi:hypothetical protein